LHFYDERSARSRRIFVIVVSALYFHREIGEVVSDLHAQIVEWRPLPKAKPDVFTVALARDPGCTAAQRG
jgi:hypothetical protein